MRRDPLIGHLPGGDFLLARLVVSVVWTRSFESPHEPYNPTD